MTTPTRSRLGAIIAQHEAAPAGGDGARLPRRSDESGLGQLRRVVLRPLRDDRPGDDASGRSPSRRPLLVDQLVDAVRDAGGFVALPTASGGLAGYQPVRRTSLMRSKCVSLLRMGSPCSRASAAIQVSLTGMGEPASFKSCRMAA